MVIIQLMINTLSNILFPPDLNTRNVEKYVLHPVKFVS